MKTCPYCAEEIQDAAIKCRYCGSSLPIPSPNSTPASPSSEHSSVKAGVEQAKRSRFTMAEQELLYQKTPKKSMTTAVVLNFLWAGAGVVYVYGANGQRSGQGVGFISFTLLSWIFTMMWVGFATITFGLFIFSTVKCSQEIQRQNAELRADISTGVFDSQM